MSALVDRIIAAIRRDYARGRRVDFVLVTLDQFDVLRTDPGVTHVQTRPHIIGVPLVVQGSSRERNLIASGALGIGPPSTPRANAPSPESNDVTP